MTGDTIKWIARFILCESCRNTSCGNHTVECSAIAETFGVTVEDIRKNRYRIIDAIEDDVFLGEWVLDISYDDDVYSWNTERFNVDVSSYFTEECADSSEEGCLEAQKDLERATKNLAKHMELIGGKYELPETKDGICKEV
jgi:hypothetical protein